MNDNKDKIKELYTRVMTAKTYVEWLRAQADYVEHATQFNESIKIALMCVNRSFLCESSECNRTHVESDFTVWKDAEYYQKTGGIRRSIIAMLEFCKFDLMAKERFVLTADNMLPPDFAQEMIDEQEGLSPEDETKGRKPQ